MPVVEARISDVAMRAAERYARYVALNRMFADYRDGLLPVYRHIIWALLQLTGQSPELVKTNEVVGMVIGRYHPHGDMAVQDALSKLTQTHMYVNPVHGSGNFGTRLGDPPAAGRYTECRLSEYGRFFVRPQYLKCVPHVWNYTGKERIPVYLPSVLPNLLLNGTFGIGYGAMARIPSFTVKSIEKMIAKWFAKKNLAKDMADTLEIYPLTNYKVDYSHEGLKRFYETGEGSLRSEPKLEIDGYSIRIVGFYQMNLESFAEKLKEQPFIRDVGDISQDAPVVLVECTRNKESVAKARELIIKELTFTAPLQVNVIVNDVPDGYESDNETLPSRVDPFSISQLIDEWCKYRVDLEKRMLTIHKQELCDKRDRVNWLIAASDKLAEITKLLQAKLEKPELIKRTAKVCGFSLDAAASFVCQISKSRRCVSNTTN